MRLVRVVVALTAACFACGAHAEFRTGMTRLAGMQTEEAASDLGARGYVPAGREHWWNPAQGLCVMLPLTEGRVASVQTVAPGDCTAKLSRDWVKIGPGAGCPMDLAEADRDLFPDCRNIMAGR